MSSSWFVPGVAGASATVLLAACSKGLAPAPRPPPPRATPAPLAVNADATVLSAQQKARDRQLVPKAEAILAAYANVSPSLSPDGKRLLFRSNRGGVSEAYVSDVASPSAPAHRVIAGPEAVHTVQWSRSGKWLLFARDQNGDGNYHYFRAAADGSELVDLTPGATTRRENLFLPRQQPDRMVYSTRASDSPVTQVLVQSIAGGAAKVVHSDPGPGYLLGGNAAGTHALLLRFVSLGDQIVFDVDLATGQGRRLYPPEGTSSGVFDAAYAADGRRVFVATDEGKEGSSVLALDAQTAVEKARYTLTESPGAMISALAVSPRGDQIAIEIEAGSVRTFS